MASSFHEMLQRNWQLKVISLVLAIMAWYFVMGEEQVEISAPVEVTINVPKKHVVEDGNTQTKYATLRGPRVFLGSLIHKKKLHARIKIDVPKLGRNRYQLGRSDLVEAIDPRVVIDILDPLIDFDVKARGDPPSVEVSGTKEAIDEIDEIEPPAVDIGGKAGNFEAAVELKAPQGSSVRVRPRSVKVKAIITEMVSRRVFNGLSVKPENCPPGTRVKPTVVSVEVEGIKSSVEGLLQNEIKVFANCEGQTDRSFEKRIQVEIKGFDRSRVRPEFGVLILGE